MNRLVNLQYLNALESFYSEAYSAATTDHKSRAAKSIERARRYSIIIDKHIMKGVNV